MADLPISKERMIATLGAAEVGGKSAYDLSQGKFVGPAHVNLADRSWVDPSAQNESTSRRNADTLTAGLAGMGGANAAAMVGPGSLTPADTQFLNSFFTTDAGTQFVGTVTSQRFEQIGHRYTQFIDVAINSGNQSTVDFLGFPAGAILVTSLDNTFALKSQNGLLALFAGQSGYLLGNNDVKSPETWNVASFVDLWVANSTDKRGVAGLIIKAPSKRRKLERF